MLSGGGINVCSAVVDLTDGTSLKQFPRDTSCTFLEIKFNVLPCNWILVLSKSMIRYDIFVLQTIAMHLS